jgi:peptide/nickel transport system permease protein
MSTPARSTGAVVLAVVLAIGVIGPWVIDASPIGQDLDRVLMAPSAAHPLGTDHLGRDVLARLAHAVRLSIGLVLVGVASAALIGTSLGLFAAWHGGWIERGLVTAADAVLALPALLLVLLVIAFAPGEWWPIAVGISLSLWVEYFRVVRAKASVLLASPQVEASRLLGFGGLYIVRRHLLPELAAILRTLMVFGSATTVLALATVGFLGVGMRPPTPELGLLMTEAFPYYVEAPWVIAAPVVTLVAGVLGLALMAGDAWPR